MSPEFDADSDGAETDDLLEPVPPSEDTPPQPPRRQAGNRGADLGRLVDEQQDKMVVHTREGLLLFAGRARDAERNLSGIVGGRRAAAAASVVWYLSGNDNPYADWALLATSAGLDAAHQAIAAANEMHCAKVVELRQRGLNLSVQQSARPAELSIGFRSPYGYSIAELVVHYDYFVRLIKTLVHKGQLSDEQGREAIGAVRRRCRAAFEVPVRHERSFTHRELKALTRADFLSNTAEAQQRVALAAGLFGPLPRDVFTGALRPRHSKRRVRLSEQELRLLEAAQDGIAVSQVDVDQASLL
jgi:integrating conjugative element protein (TIGR03761 family)